VSFGNYSELSTAALGWLDIVSGQAGVSTTRMAEAAALVNARLRRKLLSVEGLAETTGTAATVDGVTTIDVPAGFRAAHGMELLDDDGYYRPIEELGMRLVYRYGALELQPALSGEYTYRLAYWDTLSELSASADTNWVLSKAPDVYLYGILTHLGGFLADERTEGWGQMYDLATEELMELSNKMAAMRVSVNASVGGGTP
jgi:hypothetical protein